VKGALAVRIPTANLLKKDERSVPAQARLTRNQLLRMMLSSTLLQSILNTENWSNDYPEELERFLESKRYYIYMII